MSSSPTSKIAELDFSAVNTALSNAFFKVKHLTSMMTGFNPAFLIIEVYEFTSDNFEATNKISIVFALEFRLIT